MDKVLKQRLVGASILIALAVIFLPMLFDGGADERTERRELALDLPAGDEGERRIRRLSLDPAEARRPDSGIADERPDDADHPERPDPTRAEPEAARPVSPPEVEAPADAPVEAEEGNASDEPEAAGPDETEEAAPLASAAVEDNEKTEERDDAGEASDPVEPEPAAEPADAVAAQPGGGWAVQVAVFGNPETAGSIRDRLQQLGHEVMVDVIVRNEAELHRLRTGPYASKASAERARGQIAATVAGVEPVVRELATVSGNEDRRGMSVQVGSFASRNNAERLVAQLTGSGHDAFMHGEVSGGRTIWRVRVGTFETREEAERLLQRLTEEQSLQGIVVSHP